MGLLVFRAVSMALARSSSQQISIVIVCSFLQNFVMGRPGIPLGVTPEAARDCQFKGESRLVFPAPKHIHCLDLLKNIIIVEQKTRRVRALA
jgi:hypothetical protein